MREFYEQFYAHALKSQAHAEFCERTFGRDLCQHGFADMAQVDALIEATGLLPGHQMLDLGCGYGMIAEYLSDVTGTHVLGIDYVPEAVQQARARTTRAGKTHRLWFEVGDINALALQVTTYDAIVSIDTLYFSDDLTRTVGELAAALKPDGRMAIYYTYGWEPGMNAETFPAETLAPDRTPLGEALQAHDLPFRTHDVTVAECRLAGVRRAVLEELEAAFEADRLRFEWENRMGEARGIAQSCALGLFRRYLYVATKKG